MKTIKSISYSVLATAISAAFATGVNAQDAVENTTNAETAEDVEKILVIARRQPYRGNVSLKELPQSVDVVPAEFLNDLGIVDLQNALDFTSGVSRQNSFGGLWDSFAIRGFAGDENLPSGYLINGFSAGRGFSGRRDTSNIQAIEVMKGPGSALFGRSEPGGTINIITKKPRLNEEGYLQATVGSYDFYRLEGDYTNAINDDIAFRINGAYVDAGSFRDTVESKKLALTPSISYQITADTALNYELEIQDQEAPFDRGIVVLDYDFNTVPIENYYGDPADGPMKVKGIGHQFTVEHTLNESWNLLFGVNYRESSFTGYSTDPELARGRQLVYTDGTTLSRQRRFRDFDASDLSARVEFSGDLDVLGFKHNMLIGVDAYDYELDQIMQRWRVAPGDDTYAVDLQNPQYDQPLPTLSPLWDQKETQKSYGIYLQDQIDLTEQFKLLLGVRFDDLKKNFYNYLTSTELKQSDTAISPRLGLVYEASKLYTLYFSFSEGFRPNSGSDVDGNSFQPEESKSYEAGIKFNNADDTISGTLAVFRAEKSNVLTADPINSSYSAALGEAESQGIELDLNANLASDTVLSVAYSYVDATTSNEVINFDWGVSIPAGSRLINIPEHQFNFTVLQHFSLAGKEAKVGASLTYVGDRLGETIDADYILPAYTTVRLFSSVNLSSRWVLNADIDNLFDKKYYTSSYSALWTQPGAPLTARVSLRYQF